MKVKVLLMQGDNYKGWRDIENIPTMNEPTSAEEYISSVQNTSLLTFSNESTVSGSKMIATLSPSTRADVFIEEVEIEAHPARAAHWTGQGLMVIGLVNERSARMSVKGIL